MTTTARLDGITATIVPLERALGSLTETQRREVRVRVRAALAAFGTETVTDPLPFDPFTDCDAGPPAVRACYDLPTAMYVLGRRPAETVVIGELSLSGDVRSVRGVVPVALATRAAGIQTLIVPASQVDEAAMVPGVEVLGVRTLADAVAGNWVLPSGQDPRGAGPRSPDPADLRGPAREVYDLAAERVARGEGVLLVGPPGSGKTMIARRLTRALPELGAEEALELAAIRSAAGLGPALGRPFRAPHHTASAVALTGGGAPPRPGEVTLAHGGILFLDELPEFPRDALDSLAVNLQAGEARFGRYGVSMSARPVVVAAMNPCPCGNMGSRKRECRCKPESIERYRARAERFADALGLVTYLVAPVEGRGLRGGAA